MRASFVLTCLTFVACTAPGSAPAPAATVPLPLPPPGALTLAPPAWALAGGSAAVLLEGAAPGANVGLVAGQTTSGAAACPPALAPTCLDLSAPVYVLSLGRTDAEGRRAFVVRLPPTLAGQTILLEGVEAEPGGFDTTDPFAMAVLDPSGDEDGDGVTNGIEATYGLDLYDPDTDGDGLPDDEYARYMCSPLLVDTDADGLDDGDEVALGTLPWLWDTDGDLAPDGAELTFGSNPLDPDTDDDGLNDGGEFMLGTDPNDPDTDDDGLDDATERVAGTDALDPDTDDDLLPDGVDPDPFEPDSDGDGLVDGLELALGTDPALADTDDDGLRDPDDLGPTLPTDPDTDHDSLYDGTELLIGTDPTVADTDGDGLLDGAEVLTRRTLATVVDTDSDGMADGDEVAAGRDPRGTSSIPGDGGSYDGEAAALLAEVVDHALGDAGDFVQVYNAGELPSVLQGWAIHIGVYYDPTLGLDDRRIIPLPRWAALAPGQSWVVAQGPIFDAAYGPASQHSGAMILSGDEPVRLMRSIATAEDVFAPWHTDLLGTAWDYHHTVVKRAAGVDRPNYGTEDLGEWSFSPGHTAANPFDRM